MDATGWNGGGGGPVPLREPARARSLSAETGLRDEVVVSQIRTNTDIFTIFAALFTFNRNISWEKQSITVYEMLEEQGNTYAGFTKVSTFE